jgi:hypothetical protein
MKIKSCNHIATQSNRLTEARYGLTVGEQKVILLLISMISPEDKELRDYEMKVIDFAQIMGLKSHNLYDRLSETLDKLLSRILHIPTDTGYLLKLSISYFLVLLQEHIYSYAISTLKLGNYE